ncbi:MAG TPA: hypothetical protein VN831_03605, partial [Bradyrhizobium sp.]|nr:hypothetical protein [Bradyrhizobium sp.]
NHMLPPFTENKRWRMKPRVIGDVVNPKAVSVYQTDAVLVLIDGADRALATTKQCRVRRCSKEYILRSSPEHLVFMPDFIKPQRSKRPEFRSLP